MLKRNRPGFSNSKAPEQAKDLYQKFNKELEGYGLIVKTGEFGTHMNVEINNDGPVTLIYESQDGKNNMKKIDSWLTKHGLKIDLRS